jgi:hypothetical protein
VLTPTGGRFVWLRQGRAGNLQTAAQMATLVREDTFRDEGLKFFAARRLMIDNGLDSHSDPRRIIDAIFRYVQRIAYIADPGGEFDAIHSARETLAKAYGDCDDLSVLLATLLACVGFNPSFVLARYNKDNPGYDHVYVEVPTKAGRIVLDPTTRTHGAGWENPKALERITFPIFGERGPGTSLGSATALATTGATIGLNFVPVVGPILSALAAPIIGLFDKTQQRQYEAARETMMLQAVDAVHQINAAVEDCRITPQQGAAQARQVLQKFYAACDANLGGIAKTCRNYDANGEFTGYINTMEKFSGCAGRGQTADAGTAVGSAGASGLGGLNVSLPTVLLMIGGVFLGAKLLRG